MEVVNPRAALLSNFEVLALLRELDVDHVARAKTALRIKKEEDAAGRPVHGDSHTEEVYENLRTVELEAIQYLSAEYQPTRRQSDAGIAQLVKDLAPFALTKAEKLQIVNLAPTEPVELYVVVEELEDRLGEKMEQVLSVVSTSLHATAGAGSVGNVASYESAAPRSVAQPQVEIYEEDGQWEYDAAADMYDDFGEGVGVEGDLDMDDDGE